MKRFERVQQILEQAVNGDTIGAHGNFWRGLTLDQFKAKKVFGKVLIVSGDSDASNLIRALEGKSPFGADTGTPGATFDRMPANRPPVPPDQIAFIRKWIVDGCPDDDVASDPAVHNAYWREFDNWAMFQATMEVQDAIGVFFNEVPLWAALAKNAAALPAWTAAIAKPEFQSAIQLLGGKILSTARTHYGTPVDRDRFLESYELFGADKLPNDPLRPVDPRHNMNGAVMWFFYSAFVDASLRAASPNQDWFTFGRAVALGLINDGLFRHRFPVVGFSADPAGSAAARTHCASLADNQVAPELARRFVDSNFNLTN